MKCHAYLICESIGLAKLHSLANYKQTIILKENDDIAFVFPYGVVIVWGSGHLFPIEREIDHALKGKLSASERLLDEFDVVVEQGKKLVHEDIIYLPEEETNIMLAISHGIAQSLRLSRLEDEILKLMNVNKQIPEDLARKGKIHKSKKQIAKLRGELYLKKSRMSFEYTILDKPEFFWEYPEYDEYYTKTIEYLELNPRLEILAKKFQTIDEILSILADELNHRHSSRLEWIIILLIMIEIVIFFLQDVFKVI